MANPNPEIWGAVNSWVYSELAYGIEGAGARFAGYAKPMTANFGDGMTQGYRGSLLRAINVTHKMTLNEKLDRSICPCGQSPDVSPWGKIAIFNENSDLSTTPSRIITDTNNINWFLCDRNQLGNNSRYFSKVYNNGNNGGLAFQQFAPLAYSPTSSYNSCMRLTPYVYYGLRSFVATIQVHLLPKNGTYDDIAVNSIWTNLGSWVNYKDTHDLIGLRLFFRNCTALNASTLVLTYNNDTSQYGGQYSNQIAVIQDITVNNNGNNVETEFLSLNMESGVSYRSGYIFDVCNVQNYPSSDNRRTNGVLPCWEYFDGQQIKRWKRPDNYDGAFWYTIPYSQANYDKVMKIAALFGCFFTPTTKYTFNYDMLDNDLYLPILDDNGVTHGQYTRGADNANNPLYTKNSIRDIDYNPDVPPTPVDPNTYSDTTNWNNVDFRQAFTKRYLLTGSQVASLATELWAAQSSKPADIDYNNFAIDEYLTNNPIDTIVSLKYFPCTFADTAPAVVHLGKYTTNIAATALGTSVRIIDFAPIECFPHFEDFRDYEPYTELAMYVPFCGTVKLPTAECMGNYVSVKLAIDTNTGAATGYIIVSKTGMGGICVATCQGMAAIDIPVSGLQSANLANAVFNATANWTQTQVNNISANSGLFRHMGGAMGAIARGMTNSIGLSDVKGGILGGPIGAAGGLINSLNPISALQKGMNIDIDNAKADYELSHIQVPTRLVGSASPVLGCVIELDCRLIIYRPVTDENALSNYGDTVGYATLQGGTVGQFEGFTVGTIDVSGINATAKEKQAIAAAFANGVYL